MHQFDPSCIFDDEESILDLFETELLEGNNLIQEFICKYDCIKKLKISDKTLAKTLDKNIPYNGHYFRRLPEKIFC